MGKRRKGPSVMVRSPPHRGPLLLPLKPVELGPVLRRLTALEKRLLANPPGRV